MIERKHLATFNAKTLQVEYDFFDDGILVGPVIKKQPTYDEHGNMMHITMRKCHHQADEKILFTAVLIPKLPNIKCCQCVGFKREDMGPNNCIQRYIDVIYDLVSHGKELPECSDCQEVSQFCVTEFIKTEEEFTKRITSVLEAQNEAETAIIH
jgi:hypothetical protein